MTKLTIIHTSPVEITEVKSGLLGTHLCFASEAYAMGQVNFEYHLEVDENDIISANSMYYADETPVNTINALINYLSNYNVEIDEDDALDLLSERANIWDYDVADMSWKIQALTAQAGKELGYSIVSGTDEQGTVYFVDICVHLNNMFKLSNI